MNYKDLLEKLLQLKEHELDMPVTVLLGKNRYEAAQFLPLMLLPYSYRDESEGVTSLDLSVIIIPKNN